MSIVDKKYLHVTSLLFSRNTDVVYGPREDRRYAYRSQLIMKIDFGQVTQWPHRTVLKMVPRASREDWSVVTCRLQLVHCRLICIRDMRSVKCRSATGRNSISRCVCVGGDIGVVSCVTKDPRPVGIIM